jgi:signal transduction histidine kinase
LHAWAGPGAPTYGILEVTDTGIGLHKETQDRCFPAFFSAKSERGWGFGLTTAYRTVPPHGGEVQSG